MLINNNIIINKCHLNTKCNCFNIKFKTIINLY